MAMGEQYTTKQLGVGIGKLECLHFRAFVPVLVSGRAAGLPQRDVYLLQYNTTCTRCLSFARTFAPAWLETLPQALCHRLGRSPAAARESP